MATTTQMNFRIDGSLKTTGDLVLGQSGITPSALVRTVWEYLRQNQHAPDAVPKLLRFLETGKADDANALGKPTSTLEAEQAIMAGPNLIQQFYAEAGIDPSSIEPRSFETMKLDAYSQKYDQFNLK